MRWPWTRKPETRQAGAGGGDFGAAIIRALELEAAGTLATDSGATAAVEAVAGALSRAFMAARVEGPPWAREAVTPAFLAQCGRDLVRIGETLHVIRMGPDGNPSLTVAGQWHWTSDSGQGGDPRTWFVRATSYGPSSSKTWLLPASGVVWMPWGTGNAIPWSGRGATSWARSTASLAAGVEAHLAAEAGGPIAQLIAVPSDGGDDDEADPLKPLRDAIARARGSAFLVETTAAGWGDGKAASPQRDWVPNRLGAAPPAALVDLARDAFARTLSAFGCPAGLFAAGADGTAMRESLRQWHGGVVRPLLGRLEWELRHKLDRGIRLTTDLYAADLVGRTQALERLVGAGVPVAQAVTATGLGDAIDAEALPESMPEAMPEAGE